MYSVRFAGTDTSAGIQSFNENSNQGKYINQNQGQSTGKGQAINNQLGIGQARESREKRDQKPERQSMNKCLVLTV